MACLIVEIIMCITGFYAIVKGQFSLTDQFDLRGWRARVAGLLWALPLPLAFGIGLIVALLVVIGIAPPEAQTYVGFIEPVLVLLGFFGAIAFAFFTN